VASIMRVSFLISIIFGGIIYLLAPLLIPLIFGSGFARSTPMIRGILPGVMVMVVFRILNSRLAGMGKPQLAIYSFIPALVINLILNILWIPQYGGMGAVWATNISYAFGCVIFLFAYSWKVKMPIIEIFRFRKSDFYFFRNIRNRFKGKAIF
jgi:O-antigen/teichoic acid export membrane protein